MADNLDEPASKYALDADEVRSTRDDEHRQPDAHRGDEVKIRACLVCKKQFLSAWAGERICFNCKSTSRWRGGVL